MRVLCVVKVVCSRVFCCVFIVVGVICLFNRQYLDNSIRIIITRSA